MTICQMGPFLIFMSEILHTFAPDFNGSTPLQRNREGKSESGHRELVPALFYCLILNLRK